MTARKILILLPDGVGLRNFAFTSFAELGKEKGWEVIFWNGTPFDLSALGLRELDLGGKARALTDIYKRAKINSELSHFEKKFKDPVYKSYYFPSTKKGLKAGLKNLMVSYFEKTNQGESGLERLRRKMETSERGGEYYMHCKDLLRKEEPDLVFCTNQRAVNAIAPVTAAKDLNIPTACFIFSWDNLPKATKVIDTDHYFVWSDYMKEELQAYYPYIADEQIEVTGSPQFEPHFNEGLRISREEFYEKFKLDPESSYLCYSGDDITTAPHDEVYLKDTAEAVKRLNENGENIGIIFRRSPVDNSGRYDDVLREYQDVIFPIEPDWVQLGDAWNTVLPSMADLKLQTNIIQHTFMVINVASSMVFDYASYGKPCAYIHYNPHLPEVKKDTRSIYKYVHFRSMPDKDAALWINEKSEIATIIMQVRDEQTEHIFEKARAWFDIIEQPEHGTASEKIWQKFEEIIP